jgi:hypothetical protein
MNLEGLTINVTQEDIDAGLAGNCFDCPVARAVNRAMKADDSAVENVVAAVTRAYVSISGNTRYRTYGIPFAVSEFIHAFDYLTNVEERARQVKPFTFTIGAEISF